MSSQAPPITVKSGPNVADAVLVSYGRQALDTELAGLSRLRERLDATFAAACRLLLACQGRVVVTGMGKSGHVAGKIASTLASTGTPAFFLHPGEAGHGDLGMITRQDVLLALSNSGATAEVLTLLPQLKRLGVPLIALTGRLDSPLAQAADVTIDVGVEQEACPHNLAPTASTTAALAMGDALAVAVLEARGFSAEDFARSHPVGNLGRRLLLRVEDLMRRGDAVPRVGPEELLAGGLLEMSRKGLGMTAIVGAGDQVLGVFTDGDLRRALDAHVDVHQIRMQQVMTRGGHSIGPRELAAAAAHLMETHRITALLVVDAEHRLIGALNVHDLMRAGVV
ncbi:MAG TPA: KpsF/GutQ family sugar-phosphate isomerase [Steroidobacteraceae bacterium]|nr:KpsF/GutQ family sugar-phosphate isomerase [Steroidobacteraceae bacterium]